MQISNVISGLADPTTWGKKSETALNAGASATKLIDSQVQASPAAQKASVEILRQYDVTNITPEAFSQLVQKLYKAGAITEKDFQETLGCSCRFGKSRRGIQRIRQYVGVLLR